MLCYTNDFQNGFQIDFQNYFQNDFKNDFQNDFQSDFQSDFKNDSQINKSQGPTVQGSKGLKLPNSWTILLFSKPPQFKLDSEATLTRHTRLETNF